MDKQPLDELALEALRLRKAAIDAEIDALRGQTGRTRTRGRGNPIKKRATRSAAARKAQGQRMKEYWAKRKAASARRLEI